uniref:ERCC4 domain-containing protein n=1 Tax=Macrostomum lignano TaxID=282301 RepID=A0A1I8JLS6_9PLAT
IRKPVDFAQQGEPAGPLRHPADPRLLERAWCARCPAPCRTIHRCLLPCLRCRTTNCLLRSKSKLHVSLGATRPPWPACCCSRRPAAADQPLAEQFCERNLDEAQHAGTARLACTPCWSLRAACSGNCNLTQALTYWGIVNLDSRPLAYWGIAPPSATVIVSKLDVDINQNVCRIAMHGRPLELLNLRPTIALLQLPKLVRVYRQSVGEAGWTGSRTPTPVVVTGLFRKETALDVFIGLQVSLSTGQQGRIEGSFGQSGKCTVRMSEPLSDEFCQRYGGGKRAKKRRQRGDGRLGAGRVYRRPAGLRERAVPGPLSPGRLSGPRRRPLPHRLAAQLIRLYSDPAHLVLVVNARPDEAAFYASTSSAPASLPAPRLSRRRLAPSPLSSRRLRGAGSTTKAACFLLSSAQILVVDFLRSVVPTDAVSGIIVMHADEVLDLCQEAFVLRLYREANPTGFIKAITDRARAFTRGGFGIERILRTLFVPGCVPAAPSVAACMDACPHTVEEVRVNLTEPMLRCQSALVDLLKACMQELARSAPVLDANELTVENALTRGFDQLLRSYTDPGVAPHEPTEPAAGGRHQNSAEIPAGADSGGPGRLSPPSGLGDQQREGLRRQLRLAVPGRGDRLLAASKARLGSGPASYEVPPKWLSCRAILQEVERERLDQQRPPAAQQQRLRTLIIVHDSSTQCQLLAFLTSGAEAAFAADANSAADSADEDAVKTTTTATTSTLSKKSSRKTAAKKKSKEPNLLTLTQMIRPASDVDDQPQQQGDDVEAVEKVDQPTSEIVDESELKRRFPVGAAVRPVRLSSRDVRCSAPGWWQRRGRRARRQDSSWGHQQALPMLLDCWRPHRVLLYDPDSTSAAGVVYFFVYEGSVEEQRYLTQLRKEKEAFEFLIRERSVAVVTSEPVVKGDLAPVEELAGPDDGIARGRRRAASGEGWMPGDLKPPPLPAQVIVDVREFRSELPCLLHRRGITILPVTIDVGDYVLTPDICVERKSVSDLIGSLNSGRLYNQSGAAHRIRRRAHRLRPLPRPGRHELGTELLGHDLPPEPAHPALPQLRILWSPAPHASAELFHDLKRGRPQPQLQLLPSVSAATAGDFYNDVDDSEASSSTSLTPAASAATLRHVARSMLLRMPGVTHRSLRGLIKAAGGSFAGLCRLGVGELREALGQREAADRLHEFLRTDGRRLAGGAAAGRGGARRPKLALAAKLPTARRN